MKAMKIHDFLLESEGSNGHRERRRRGRAQIRKTNSNDLRNHGWREKVKDCRAQEGASR